MVNHRYLYVSMGCHMYDLKKDSEGNLLFSSRSDENEGLRELSAVLAECPIKILVAKAHLWEQGMSL